MILPVSYFQVAHEFILCLTENGHVCPENGFNNKDVVGLTPFMLGKISNYSYENDEWAYGCPVGSHENHSRNTGANMKFLCSANVNANFSKQQEEIFKK